MTNVEMKGVRDLLCAVRTSTNWDDKTVQRIIARILLSQFIDIEWDTALDTNLPLETRVAEFVTNSHDRSLGGELARRLGLSLKEPVGVFDPLTFTGTITQLSSDIQFRDKMVRVMRNHGYRSLAVDFTPSTDGVNHYNLYSQGRTLVGQLASNFSESQDGTPFMTPHGPYRTLEGYYHVLRVLDYFLRVDDGTGLEDYPLYQYQGNPVLRDLSIFQDYSIAYPEIERMREVDGAEGIRTGRLLKKTLYGGTAYRPGAFSEHAERCFMKAVVYKLHKLKLDGVCLGNIMSEIFHQDVPFEHYYVMQGKIHTPAHADWLPGLYAKIVENIDPYATDFDPEAVIELLG